MFLMTVSYFVSVSVILRPASSECTRFKCGGVRLSDMPPFEPSKYMADPDTSTYTPFNIHFVLSDKISNETREVIENITVSINQRLGSMIKAQSLAEIRKERLWNDGLKKCDPPKCLYAVIPGEYALPCRCPYNGAIVPEDPVVPCKSTEKIKALNEPKKTTLVIYVEAEDDNEDHFRQCKEDPTMFAYAAPCQVDNQYRPTHGMVGICANVSELRGEKAERIILHQIFHILTQGSVVGMGSPFTGCPFLGDTVESLTACENVTYKSVQQEWIPPFAGRVAYRERLLATTPTVKGQVQAYFQCNSLEGAEVTSRMITPGERLALNGTVQTGKLIPDGHWSPLLFPDEILMPFSFGAMRISTITLGLLKDLGWYEVNLAAAEPMEAVRPDVSGCRIAEKSFFEIIQYRRESQALEQGEYYDQPSPTMQYCDADYREQKRIVNNRCYMDSEPLMCNTIRILGNNVSVIGRPKYYDSLTCEQTRIISEGYLPEIGSTVGPGTICLSVGLVKKNTQQRTMFDMGVCVEYECLHNENTVKMTLKPFGHPCTVMCNAFSSSKRRMIRFDDEKCKEHLSPAFEVICPDYNRVCPSPPEVEPQEFAAIPFHGPDDKAAADSKADSSKGGTIGLVLFGAFKAVVDGHD